MKKILLFFITISLLFSLFACGSEKYKTYNESDVIYKLPPDFVATNYGYGELEYSNEKGAYFFFMSFDGDELEEDQMMPRDTTVQEYAQTCITVWGVDAEYVYNKENDSATFDYHIEEDGEYYRHLVIWGSEKLFLFTLSCYSADVEKYASTFDYIFDNIRLA